MSQSPQFVELTEATDLYNGIVELYREAGKYLAGEILKEADGRIEMAYRVSENATHELNLMLLELECQQQAAKKPAPLPTLPAGSR